MPKRLILVAGTLVPEKPRLPNGLAPAWAGSPPTDRWWIIPTCRTSTPTCRVGLPPADLLPRAPRRTAPADGQDPRSAIIDRSIYEDAHIFARALHHLGNINARLPDLPPPVPAGGQRLPPLAVGIPQGSGVRPDGPHPAARQEIETGIDEDYLTRLTYYDEWIQSFDLPVLTLRSDSMDFVHDPKHLNEVVNRIQHKLAGKEEIVF